jgi:hypothetical protein
VHAGFLRAELVDLYTSFGKSTPLARSRRSGRYDRVTLDLASRRPWRWDGIKVFSTEEAEKATE